MHARIAGCLLLVGMSSLLFGCGGTEPVEEISINQSGPVEPVEPARFGPDDWPWWRGPQRNGVSSSSNAPVEWTENEGVLWKTPVPGRGHSSPTVLGNGVFLTTADEQRGVQSVLCYDRESGEQLWRTDAHTEGLPSSLGSAKSTHASSTVACDGRRLFAAFLNSGEIWVTALTLDGQKLWQTRVGPFDSSYGYAASPSIYESFVIVAADHKSGGYIAALHRKTGDIQWRKPRPAEQSYASPIVAEVDGTDQVLISGAYRVASYDPETGDELWSCAATTMSCAGTMNYWNGLVYAGAGYPDSEVICIRADGSGEIVWQNRTKMYVPSLLVHDGLVYGVSDDGRAYCWDARTGEVNWRGRLGGNFSASPVLAGGRIYVPNESGVVFVLRASPAKLDVLARNRTGDEIMATPTICANRIYLRAASRSGFGRQETLYCIGRAAAQ